MNVDISELTLIIEQNIIETLNSVIQEEEDELKTPISIISEQRLTLSKEIKHGDCSICLELLNSSDHEYCLSITKCNHTFHESCIVTWLSTKTTCPICRANLLDDTSNVDR